MERKIMLRPAFVRPVLAPSAEIPSSSFDKLKMRTTDRPVQ